MKKSTSFRLSEEALKILKANAKKQGLTQGAYLEVIIRATKEKK